ncbi:MAG: hypothetical protein WD275_08095 [Rhodothermales bacterium]
MPSLRFLPLTVLLLGPAATQAHAQAELPVIHISDYLSGLEETRTALDAVYTQPASKHGGTQAAYEIGDTRTFKVYNHDESSRTTSMVLDDLNFTLLAEGEHFLVWVETSELNNGHVRETDVISLSNALQDETPEGSIDASSGILDNNERIFGAPPDVDGDDRTDILLVDIRDGWVSGSTRGYVAGFVWSGDLSRTGNHRDVVYADVNPGLFREGNHLSTAGIEATVAHEYQHLIHFNYDLKELTFVNEGLAEWASVMNGYSTRNISYLADAKEHNVSLLDWREDAASLSDYQRAGLFTTYLAQRLGVEATGRIVRARSGSANLIGVDGYHLVAADAGLEFPDLVSDFHVANYLNDRILGDEFGYELQSRSLVRAMPTFSYEGAGNDVMADFPFNAGSVQYFVWSEITNLSLTIDVSSTIPASMVSSMRDRMRITTVAERFDGDADIRRWDVDGIPMVFEGEYDRISVILVHHSAEAKGVRLDFSAVWGTSSSVAAETSELPLSVTLDQNYPNPFNPQTHIRYQLYEAAHVRLRVFDALGRQAAVLVDRHLPAGNHEAVLDAADWPGGTYLYVLESGSRSLYKAMTLAR